VPIQILEITVDKKGCRSRSMRKWDILFAVSRKQNAVFYNLMTISFETQFMQINEIE
jgi:hypothetical protein